MDELIQTLPKLLRASGDAEEVVEVAAFVAWRRVAGEAIRGCAVPFRLYRKTLIVAVPDQTWRKQMEAMSGQLIFRINSILGQALVTYIEFRVDPQTVAAERERSQQPSAYERLRREEGALELAAELDEAAAAIHDEELRRRFLLAAGSCMMRSGK